MTPIWTSMNVRARRRAIWLLCLTALVMACSACTKKTESPRVPAATATLTVPVQTVTLPNGLRVLIHKDQSTPFVTINLSAIAGSGHELIGEEGAAYLLQYLLFQAGSGLKEPVMKLLEDAGADTAGGAVNSYVDYDRLTLTSTVPAQGLETVLWLESRRLHDFLDQLSDDVFERQRALLRDSLLSSHEKPYGLQNDLISRHIYPRGHPYAKPVTASPDEIAQLTPRAVRAFYRRNLTPQNSVLVVSGNIDPAATLEQIKILFGPIRPAPSTTQVVSDDSGTEPRKRVVHRSSAPAKQVFVWKAPNAASPQLSALEMTSVLLTGSKTSRLHEQLVRQDKLAVHVSSSVQPARLGSEFLIEVYPAPGADPERISAAVAKVIAQAVQQGFGESDVAAVRAKAEFEFLRSIESSAGTSGKASRYARALLFEPLLGTVDDRFFTLQHQTIAGQTSESIAAAMRNYLVREPALEILYVPAEYRSTSQALVEAPSPSAQQPLPAILPAFVRKELPNGLELIVFNRTQEGAANHLGTVDIDLVIKTADLFESEDASGTSMLTAKAVLAGTKTRSAFQIENAVNSFGGNVSSEGSKLGARITMSGLRRHLDGIFELLSDVALNPVFPDAELAAVRTIVSEKMGREQMQPLQAANMMFLKILFAGGHPGGTAADGTPEAVAKLSPTHLKDHHQKYWVPNNAALVVSGAVSVEEAERLANKHFAFWSKKPLDAVTLQELPGPDRPYTFLVNIPGMEEVMIRTGSVAPYRGHADEVPLQVLNQVLLNSAHEPPHEDLLTNARYSSALIQNRYFGAWMQGANAVPANAVTVMEAMRQHLTDLSHSRHSRSSKNELAPHLARAQNELARSFLKSFGTISSANRTTSALAMAGIEPTFINRYVPDLYKIGVHDFAQTAVRYAGHNRQIILFMGNTKGIEPVLLKRGFTDIVTLDQSGKFLKRSGS